MRALLSHIGACAVVLVLAVPQSLSARVFDPATFTLDNGMEVVVVENRRVPVVSHMVWYKVGAADEEPGKTGLAHLFEHLMFKGTNEIPPGEFSKIVARQGGRDNAFTSSDYTGYFQNIAADKLELVMKMEADRMHNLRLSVQDVLTERDVVLEERRSRTDNNPSALLAERMDAAFYIRHPYRNPVIGWPEEVSKLDLEDALAFYKRWYAPNNAILVVAGDVDPARVKDLARKYYGAIPRGDVPVRNRPEDPPLVAAKRVELRDPRVQQPAWSRYYQAPSYRSGATEMAYPLQVLAEVLGGSATSRLYRELAVGQELAAGASAWYNPTAYDRSVFGIGVSPRPGIDMEKIEAATEAVLAKVLTQGLSEEEVEQAKKRLRANVAYARDSLHTGARVLGEALTTGQNVADVESWPERIGAVTAAQVAEAARAVLRTESSVTGLLLPEPRG